MEKYFPNIPSYFFCKVSMTVSTQKGRSQRFFKGGFRFFCMDGKFFRRFFTKNPKLKKVFVEARVTPKTPLTTLLPQSHFSFSYSQLPQAIRLDSIHLIHSIMSQICLNFFYNVARRLLSNKYSCILTISFPTHFLFTLFFTKKSFILC